MVKIGEDELATIISYAGESAAGAILDHLRQVNITKGCYAHKMRVKTRDDLISKKNRKITLENKPDYKLSSITDVIGIRLVTLFKGDMVRVFTDFLRILGDPSNAATDTKLESQLFPGLPEEIIVFTGTSSLNRFANQICAATDSIFKGKADFVKVLPSEAGYSSIHIVCRYKDELQKSVSKINHFGMTIDPFGGEFKGIDDSATYRLPIEIQIRTVFEDAWGEIDHQYGYSNRKGKEVEPQLVISASVLSHLRVLKDFTDACMDYAECIRGDALGTSNRSGPEKVISIDTNKALLKRFRELGIKNEFLSKYEALGHRQKEAMGDNLSQQYHSSESSQTLGGIASDYARLADELCAGRNASSLTQGEKLAFYYCTMNEALCLMSTNLSNDLSAAIEKYSRLERDFPSYPMISVRLGQALGRAGQYDAGIAVLKAAGVQIRSLSALRGESGKWEDNLPKTDYLFMSYTQPKLLGYFLWKKTQELHGEVFAREKASLLLEAHSVTKACLDTPDLEDDLRSGIINNLLYYSAGYLFYADSSESHVEAMKECIRKYLEDVGQPSQFDGLETRTLDTVFKAYALLNDKPIADQLAEQLIEACLNPANPLLSDIRLKLGEVAQHYKKTGLILGF